MVIVRVMRECSQPAMSLTRVLKRPHMHSKLRLHHGSRIRSTEHLEKALSHSRLELCSISCDFDLTIGVPWVSEAPRAVKWQAVRGHPLDPEGFPPALSNHWSFFFYMAFFFFCVLLFSL